MVVIITIVAILLLGVGAYVAAGALGGMEKDVERDAYVPTLPDTPLTADDLEAVRFGTGLRGYDMAQVDAVLARLAHEIADRDARIAALTATPEPEPEGASAEVERPKVQRAEVDAAAWDPDRGEETPTRSAVDPVDAE